MLLVDPSTSFEQGGLLKSFDENEQPLKASTQLQETITLPPDKTAENASIIILGRLARRVKCPFIWPPEITSSDADHNDQLLSTIPPFLSLPASAVVVPPDDRLSNSTESPAATMLSQSIKSSFPGRSTAMSAS